MGFFQKIRAIWRKLGVIQQALVIAVVVTFVIVGSLLVHWARKPDMRMLYQQLSPEEAAKIVEKIAEKGTSYELREGGTTIYAPKEKIYQLRLDMAREGLPEGEQGGYKIFDKEKIGISPFVQNVNLKRALQDELAKSIQMIEGVVHVRIHIVSTEQGLFASEEGKTSASVVLRLKPGYRLGAQTVAAITHLVAGSVERLKSENVTVIDSQGVLLSGQSDQTMASGAGTVQDYRERVEQSLTRKIEDMLTAVLGPGRASVSVSAIVDMNSVSTVTETYDPTAKVASKEEITSGSETGAGGTAAGGVAATPGSTKKDETVITEYEVGKTVKQQSILPGEIKSLSVAAFVDLSKPDVNATGAGTSSSGLIMEVSEVELIIRSAIGLRQTDLLKVVNAKFHRPTELLSEEEQSNWPRYIAIARHASLGIMAICALLVLRILKGAKKKVEASASAAQLSAGGGAFGFLPAEAGKSEAIMVRRQIATSLQHNPEQVKQLFASWIEEK
jgi:flagellar M-ring protein FliF